MKVNQRFTLSLTLCAWLGGLSGAYAQASGLSIQDRSSIERTVAAIKSAIIHARTGELLQELSATLGLTCTGKTYPYHSVAAFLADKNSYLYLGLFDSAGLARACSQDYPDVSEQEFLSAGDSADSIAQVGPDWVEVTIRSPLTKHPPRVWSLHRERGSWKLADGSLIVGSCSCG